MGHVFASVKLVKGQNKYIEPLKITENFDDGEGSQNSASRVRYGDFHFLIENFFTCKLIFSSRIVFPLID
jgi:hypothetical protein